MTEARDARPRVAYLDALRILAAFLVIVNHTNSYVFMSDDPGTLEWVLSTAWYYLSKIAVPLFVTVSGACLLCKVDGYRKTAWRAARALIALLAFSYLSYFYEAWTVYGLWPRAVDIGEFLSLVWQMKILDDFWYLYMYVGLMLMLPFLQRMAQGMRPRDTLYLVGMCFGVGALWPLVTHYAPGLALPRYFFTPLFASYIGLFFAGRLLDGHAKISAKTAWWCRLALIASIAISVALTYAESLHAEKYWFMDDRAAPSILTIIAALALMALLKADCERPIADKRRAAIAELGGCAFGVYLWQGFLIAESRHRLFEPLCAHMPKLCAALVWELVVFALALALTWLMRRVRFVRKIL